ncbi:MAG: type II toxin-antitoxin system VapC family toxin [Alphaproteobacteria bacterium]|nr:MAG: type II toxin-antitoxin system VapC family toxin [Alphaproteobacteria bacterium]
MDTGAIAGRSRPRSRRPLVIYLDSSVVLAHLLIEERRPAAAFWQQVSVSSRLLEYEVWSRIGARGLGQSHREEVRASLAKIGMIELTRLSLRRALEPFPVAVRTLDALHLATMDFIRESGEPVQLASYDNRLIAAAEALGITPAAL